jgi:hypothetical protein
MARSGSPPGIVPSSNTAEDTASASSAPMPPSCCSCWEVPAAAVPADLSWPVEVAPERGSEADGVPLLSAGGGAAAAYARAWVSYASSSLL